LIPVGDVSVFLQDSASTELRGYTRSDANGMYHFSNLAYGTYYVLPDKAGVPLIDRRKVVINAANQQAEHISFQLTMSGVLNVDDTATLVEDLSTNAFKVYPNPGKSMLHIQRATAQALTLIVRDLSGKEQVRKGISMHQNTVDMSQLASGVYILEFKNENGTSEFTRWIKE
jgi:hypothetical protein